MLPYAPNAKQDNEELVAYEYEESKEVKWYHQLLLNRPLRVIIALLLIAVLTPLLVYHFLFFSSLDFPPSDGFSVGSCLLARTSRLPCGVGSVNDSYCPQPNCCPDHHNNMCYHRFPSRFSYIMDRGWDEGVLLQPRQATVPFKGRDSLRHIMLSIDDISSTHMSLTFYNSQNIALEGKRVDEKDYVYHVSSPELNVIVNGTQGQIFNTVRGPLIASDNIWEIAFKLTEETMYGLGEIPLKEGTSKIIYSNDRGLSSIPLIFAKSNGSYHGLLIDIKEATEVRILGDNNIVVRSITSEGLKFHIFVGPQPKDIMRDVMKFIGFNNELEYWMLGAHVCSDVKNTPPAAFHDLNNFMEEAAKVKLPFESHCGTMPIVFQNSQCESAETQAIERGAQLVKESHKRFIPHISPYIRYEVVAIGVRTSETCSHIVLEHGEFMLRQHNDSKTIYTGTVGEYSVFYPDYEKTTEEFIKTLWRYGTSPDGIVLENSWPLDDSKKYHNYTYKILPYFNKHFENAFINTPPWNITRPNEKIYMYTHNEYGNNFLKAFKNVHDELPLWSSSQWMNGKVVINRQNVNATWTNLVNELVETALGGISGHWLWASPICGDTEHFNVDTQTGLCVKWYMAATYLPMLKVHSKTIARHPLAFVGTNRMHIITALNRRLSLLPYFFTTLQTGPLLRPMFYQYPDSDDLSHLRSQFNVGDDLLIVPNVQPSQTHVHIVMPPGSWYEFWSGLQIEGEEGDTVTMTTTEADFLTLIRGGSIIAMQKDVKETADETRLNSDFTLTIALNCETTNKTDIYLEIVNVTECNALGTLFIKENVSVIFKADSKTLVIEVTDKDLELLCDEKEAKWANNIKKINIYGLDEEFNNYDNHREIDVTIDLCHLKQLNEIVVPIVQ